MKIAEVVGKDITFLEKWLSEDMILGAENLLDQELIRAYKVEGKAVFLIMADNNLHYDIKFELHQNKVKEVSCNCILGRKSEVCYHIITSLMHHRKIDVPQEEIVKEKKRAIKTSRLLTLLDNQDLEDFVLSQASRDKPFKLMMEARFFNKLSLGEREAFFDSIYPVHTQSVQKVVASKLNLFLRIVSELQAHIKEYLHEQDYINSHRVIYGALSKSYYIKSKMTRSHIKFDKCHEDLVASYHVCYNHVEAPELKLDIDTSLLELLQTHFVGASSKSDQSLWLLAYKRKHLKKKIFSIVEGYRNQGSLYRSPLISILWIVLDDQLKWPEKLGGLDMQSIYLILNCLKGNELIQEKQDLLISIFNHRRLNVVMSRVLLSELIPEIENPEFEDSIVQYYRESSEILYLKEASRLLKGWDTRKNLIFNTSSIGENPLGLIQFLIFTGALEKASQLLTALKDWNILVKIAEILFEKDPELLKHHYVDTLSDYLSHHFGSIAIETAEARLSLILRQTTLKYANSVRELLMSSFPQRSWS